MSASKILWTQLCKKINGLKKDKIFFVKQLVVSLEATIHKGTKQTRDAVITKTILHLKIF